MHEPPSASRCSCSTASSTFSVPRTLTAWNRSANGSLSALRRGKRNPHRRRPRREDSRCRRSPTAILTLGPSSTSAFDGSLTRRVTSRSLPHEGLGEMTPDESGSRR
ncbi:MAG: hypothetical protein MZV70_34715 [Desulfobacterales bacterium]|nr:hypothetical protein [Desulfobacterales bacterium]